MSDANLDLSIVIVGWNTCALLRDCLESLFASLEGTPDLRAEVIVVDNASTDDSVAMVRADFPRVRQIESGTNLGFARANNSALRQARGRYWLLLNPDTIVPPGALAQLTTVLDTHPDAAVCGPLLLHGDRTVQCNWARFPGLRSEWTGRLDRSQSPYRLEDLEDPERRRGLAPFACDWVGGACFVVRAAAAGDDLLDEGFFMYSEETEWCLRLRRQGGKTLCAPAVAVVHLGGASSRIVPRETRWRLFCSICRFYVKAYGPLGGALPSAVALARYLLSPLRSEKPCAS